MERQRTLRVGLSAILCALVFRMFSLGIPEKLWQTLLKPNIDAILAQTKTGQDVRFSPSLGTFSPNFVETPLPSLPEEPTLPCFFDPEAVSLYYATTKKPDVAALLAQPLTWDLRGSEPTVLILHTHSTESYTRTGETYQETASWRTADENYNMLSIGQRVQEVLAEQGIPAIQDRQLHDYPSYNGAYVHARKSVQAYLEENPSIRLILDLHRDATGENGRQMRTRAEADGQPCAQLMLVLGVNHEGYEENLSLALKLHAQLEAQDPGITRPLQLRAARFNQDLCPGSLIVEVGAAGNTRAEALLAAEELAKAIAALAEGTE